MKKRELSPKKGRWRQKTVKESRKHAVDAENGWQKQKTSVRGRNQVYKAETSDGGRK
jgi:hypothetical protein